MTVKRSPIPVNDHEAVVVLTRDMVALIDLEDADLVSRHLWHAYRNRGGTWYARTNTPWGSRPASIRMHRLIMGLGSGRDVHVDHIDGCGLNNRKSNLRPASPSENMMNRGPTKTVRSGFNGVHPHNQSGKWQAQIKSGTLRRSLGLFSDPAEAASAYDAAAVELHGEFAVLNFPEGRV